MEPSTYVDLLLQPFPEVLEELKRRQADTKLRAAVEEYLGHDLPPYFAQGPVLYVARHIATPNFETIRFLHLVEPLELTTVIGQDGSDIFAPHNVLKHALGRLCVCTRVHQRDGKTIEQFQKVTIVDFNAASGKPLNAVRTLWGEGLMEFHAYLFNKLVRRSGIIVADDSAWIDRHGRGNLLEHYKQFLALFLVHGILFEDYLVNDAEEARFIDEVLRPAFAFIEERFGYKPLVTYLHPTTVESDQFWIGYPQEVLAIVEERMQAAHPPATEALGA